MQLKHPEILWALLLLLIPIIIHFFQLRRFSKTPFTNVAMLQKVVVESRKSSTLKKWLLLFTRLLLLAGLIIAFAQPFSAKKNALKKKETVIYLDNSFSMQAMGNGVNLLEKAVQDLLKHVDREQVLTIFTNTNTFRDVTISDIQNRLLTIPFTFKQFQMDDIALKAGTLFSSDVQAQKNLVIISDFQRNMGLPTQDSTILDNAYFVPMAPSRTSNVSIDSVTIEDTNADQLTLTAFLSSTDITDPVPVSLYNGETLIAKSAADFSEKKNLQVDFSIPNGDSLNGRLEVMDSGLIYDNSFFFNLNIPEKIKVLCISDDADPNSYLSRLFGGDEFALSQYSLNQLDYSIIDSQNVLILNNLSSIPSGLFQILSAFKENGGSLIVVPAQNADISSYNQLLSSFTRTRITQELSVSKKITGISYGHPIFQNVFEKRIDNFQYPETSHYYQLNNKTPKILSLEGNDPFLIGSDGFYFFTSSLQTGISNFTGSSLIVPTFYNMALSGLQIPDLYQTLGEKSIVDVNSSLESERVLSLKGADGEFIPLQQSFPNKVRLTFEDNPIQSGTYEILNDGSPVMNLSFNYPKLESELQYLDINAFPNTTIKESVGSLFQLLEKESSITPYWKWFVILALLLALVEVIIQKFVT